MAAIDRRERARGAIQTLAAELNLPTELTILSERWNTVARLGDSQVIAKAATLANLCRLDPQHWFDQEACVCADLAANGAPVHVPWNGSRSAYVRNGLPITLWQRIDGEPAGSSAEELVDSLAELHRLSRSVVLDQPWFATITVEIPGTLAMLGERGLLDATAVAKLTNYLHRSLDIVVAANLPEGLVHGDAQRKNAMRTQTGTTWIDLEETCRGPLAWDIACLTMNPIFDAEALLDRYADISGTERVSSFHLGVLQRLRALEGVVWMLAIQDEREPAFRQEASSQLARILQTASDG